MNNISQSSKLAIACTSVLLMSCRGANEPAATAEPAGGAITLWTDSTELFMEHPALIVGRPEKFAVHLTDITDFAPLSSGRITLRFTPRGGGDRQPDPDRARQRSPRSREERDPDRHAPGRSDRGRVRLLHGVGQRRQL